MRVFVSGEVVALGNIASETPLLYVLRNDLSLNGSKYGCGLGECGACTVLINSVAARSCSITLFGILGKSVTAFEGRPKERQLYPVRQAFIDEQAAQCGYCINGMIMTVVVIFERVAVSRTK